jgi:hypothetical protein
MIWNASRGRPVAGFALGDAGACVSQAAIMPHIVGAEARAPRPTYGRSNTRKQSESEHDYGRFGCVDLGRPGGPPARSFEQGFVPRRPGCPASSVLLADFQRPRGAAHPATRTHEAALAAILVKQLLQPSAPRGKHGGCHPAAIDRGAGDRLRFAIPVQISVSRPVRPYRRRTRAVLGIHRPMPHSSQNQPGRDLRLALDQSRSPTRTDVMRR